MSPRKFSKASINSTNNSRSLSLIEIDENKIVPNQTVNDNNQISSKNSNHDSTESNDICTHYLTPCHSNSNEPLNNENIVDDYDSYSRMTTNRTDDNNKANKHPSMVIKFDSKKYKYKDINDKEDIEKQSINNQT